MFISLLEYMLNILKCFFCMGRGVYFLVIVFNRRIMLHMHGEIYSLPQKRLNSGSADLWFVLLLLRFVCSFISWAYLIYMAYKTKIVYF